MSLRLCIATSARIEVKTHTDDSMIYMHVGKKCVEISMADWFAATEYILTNTNLCENDLRRRFLECIGSMTESEMRYGGTRLQPTKYLFETEADIAAIQEQTLQNKHRLVELLNGMTAMKIQATE